MKFSQQRPSLLSSTARIQVPWVKVTIGKYTFGIFSKQGGIQIQGQYTPFSVQYPNYIKGLTITKINGQVNQYTLNIAYPITQFDDPNFFEKVFSSVSATRKIVFSYGDCSQPAYLYKEEEAIITKIQQSFDLTGSCINYTVNAVSGAALKSAGCISWISDGKLHKPSALIKQVFDTYGLNKVFTGMNNDNWTKLVAGDDKAVKLNSKRNVSALDLISYFVGCMQSVGTGNTLGKDIYILTIHDDTFYDTFVDKENDRPSGPFFKVTKTSYASEQSDAYELDIGYNTRTIVTSFAINQSENYALYYDYQKELTPKEYVRRINKKGQWEDVYAPVVTSAGGSDSFQTTAEDLAWWTKITKYPIQAQVVVQGLLRPATLMSYLRLNVIFPGGHKHIASGLYIVTKQVDKIDESGYQTTLDLTKISGDKSIAINPANI